MFHKILFLYISVQFFATYVEAIHHQQLIPHNKLSPMNIQTSKVTLVNTTKPFTLYFEAHDLEIVKNTGNTIRFYPLPFTRTHITGGLLGDKTYKLHGNFLNVNQNPHSRSGNTVNGKGTPVQGVVVFYNAFYKTFENALNYLDGVVVLSEPVEVGSKSNPDFTPFETILLSGTLRKPNSTTVTSAKNIFSWYTSLGISHSYFVYNGSYYDPETKKQISRATCIVYHPPYNSISYKQHEAFKNVLGVDGKPIETITPIYPQRSRKVEGANEVVPKALPFGRIVLLLQIGYLLIFGSSI